jgi:hypothetical protein
MFTFNMIGNECIYYENCKHLAVSKIEHQEWKFTKKNYQVI